MRNLTVITGGARSGKSTLAEKLAKERGEKVVYIATAIPFDDGMKDRIKKHRSSRPKEWVTIEKYKDFKKLMENNELLESDTILMDCITLMVSNLLLECGLDFDKCTVEQIDRVENSIFNEVEELLRTVEALQKKIIIVTNEVGMGLVPHYRLGNFFRDIAGRVNQYLGKQAEEVFFTVSGIPMKIK